MTVIMPKEFLKLALAYIDIINTFSKVYLWQRSYQNTARVLDPQNLK